MLFSTASSLCVSASCQRRWLLHSWRASGAGGPDAASLSLDVAVVRLGRKGRDAGIQPYEEEGWEVCVPRRLRSQPGRLSTPLATGLPASNAPKSEKTSTPRHSRRQPTASTAETARRGGAAFEKPPLGQPLPLLQPLLNERNNLATAHLSGNVKRSISALVLYRRIRPVFKKKLHDVDTAPTRYHM